MADSFLPQRGNFRDLITFHKAECIYDVTFYFAHQFLSKGDRTIDQMIQAARSGKQNIVEGAAASTGSRETELKLLNVARASFQELLVDYEDYLRVRELECWPFDSEKGRKCREVCYRKNDSSYYREAIRERSDTAIANIAITLIHQEDVMLRKLIEAIKRQFVENGGIREEMSKARIEYRKRNGNRREDGNK